MSQEPLPKDVKKTDLPSLVAKAKEATSKGNRAFLIMYVLYGFIAWLISPIILFVSVEVVITSFP